MLNVRLGRVVDYAAKDESMMEAAVQEFFDGTDIDLPVEYQDQISQLYKKLNGKCPAEKFKDTYG